MTNAFQANIGGRFAPLTMLVDENAELESIFTEFNKMVSNRNSNRTSRQMTPEEKPWVTDEVLDCCDQRRDLKKKKEMSLKIIESSTKRSGKT